MNAKTPYNEVIEQVGLEVAACFKTGDAPAYYVVAAELFVVHYALLLAIRSGTMEPSALRRAENLARAIETEIATTPASVEYCRRIAGLLPMECRNASNE